MCRHFNKQSCQQSYLLMVPLSLVRLIHPVHGIQIGHWPQWHLELHNDSVYAEYSIFALLTWLTIKHYFNCMVVYFCAFKCTSNLDFPCQNSKQRPSILYFFNVDHLLMVFFVFSILSTLRQPDYKLILVI